MGGNTEAVSKTVSSEINQIRQMMEGRIEKSRQSLTGQNQSAIDKIRESTNQELDALK
jgi:hypothetical protein